MAQTFVYKVRDSSGKLVQGTLDGDSQLTVTTKLRQMGYLVLDIKERGAVRKGGKISFGGRVKSKDLTVFSRQFATMVNSGLSLTKCLNILAEQTQNSILSEAAREIFRSVEAGQALSEALAKHPKIFPSIYINMVKAGETGGVLDETLLRMASHLEKEQALKSKVKSAMTYPILVLVMSGLLVGVMVTFVVPVFGNMFKDLGGTLPLPTQILINMSDFTRGYWWAIIAGAVAVFIGYKRVGRIPRARAKLDAFKLKVPLFGTLFEKAAISRFTRTLGTLIRSGVPILEALRICANTAGNVVIRDAIEGARGSIKEGETIAKPLATSGAFPPMVVQMISVGEETGALEEMLNKIADFYETEVESTVEGLTALIEPLMIALLGGVVGGILISLYLPLFSIAGLIQ